jgi:hypothetical protein
MDIKDLAEGLRQRQLQAKLAPEEMILALSDKQMIWCYITCSDCGRRFVEDDDLVRIIAEAEDIDDFFRLCDTVDKHRHEGSLQ